MVWYEDQQILFTESGLYLIAAQHTGNSNTEKDDMMKKIFMKCITSCQENIKYVLWLDRLIHLANQ